MNHCLLSDFLSDPALGSRQLASDVGADCVPHWGGFRNCLERNKVSFSKPAFGNQGHTGSDLWPRVRSAGQGQGFSSEQPDFEGRP